MQPINLRSFRKKAKEKKNSMRRFLTKLEREAPRGLDKKIAVLEKEVWQETDCLTCANCCKTMTPTFTNADMKRICKAFKYDCRCISERNGYGKKKVVTGTGSIKQNLVNS